MVAVGAPAADPVEPAPVGMEDAHPRRRRWWAALAALALLIAALVGSALVPVSYVVLSPGSVRPITSHVSVEGRDVYPPESSIAFTTVSIGSASLLEAFVGWLDDELDVLPEERVRGSRSVAENRIFNAQLMDMSKSIAVAVALQHLGLDVDIAIDGTIVRQLADGSPAAEVVEVDDLIVAVDGEPVDEPGEVGRLLQVGGVGAEHTLTIERPIDSGVRVEVTLPTVAADDDPTRAIIGIVPDDRIASFDYPIDVVIDSGTVGGPSAGLAFALAVLDVLTPGELTGGYRVATTGTINLDGTVGRVGGAAQKAVAVRNAGYEVFLVPADEVEEVKEAVGGDLRVVGVGTLADALEALDALGGAAGTLAAVRG